MTYAVSKAPDAHLPHRRRRLIWIGAASPASNVQAHIWSDLGLGTSRVTTFASYLSMSLEALPSCFYAVTPLAAQRLPPRIH